MIEVATQIQVSGVTAKQVYDFMMGCDDIRYQQWWPGTHFRFHTLKRNPGNVGNIVFFDERIGRRRIRSRAVVKTADEHSKIVWQLKSLFLLPVWLELELLENGDVLTISHAMRVGYRGIGKCFDLFFSLFVNKKFEAKLNRHAVYEFSLLAEQLGSA